MQATTDAYTQNAAAQLPQAPPGDAQANGQLLAMLQQQQQQQMQQQQAFLLQMMQQQQQMMQQQQQQQQQPNAAVQLLTLQAVGQLNQFHGRADASGLAAREWLMHAELHFSARENALGVTAEQSDIQRVMAARTAMAGEAFRWLSTLPQQPTSWTAFRELFQQRFSSLPAAQVREANLHKFVDAARRVRERLNVDGLQRYTTLFLQHAGEIPAERMTDATKRALYAQGLPPYHAEFVLREDARPDAVPLYELAQRILSRAAIRAHANAGASASSPAHAANGDAMQIDAISLAAVQFGISREEAARYFDSEEGWTPHDTDHHTAPRPQGQAQLTEDTAQKLLAAMTSGRFAGGQLTGSSSSRGGGGRRQVPADIKKDVPEPLAKERQAAGLCIKCGVARYEPGGKGHNSRTCKSATDLTTTVAEGKRRAGLSFQ